MAKKMTSSDLEITQIDQLYPISRGQTKPIELTGSGFKSTVLSKYTFEFYRYDRRSGRWISNPNVKGTCSQRDYDTRMTVSVNNTSANEYPGCYKIILYFEDDSAEQVWVKIGIPIEDECGDPPSDSLRRKKGKKNKDDAYQKNGDKSGGEAK